MLDKMKEEDVNLIVSAGDQVEDQSWGKSSEYAAFFAPEEMTSLLYAPAVGNHDRHYMFDDHFNLPNEMSVDGNAASLNQVKTTFRGQNSGTSQSHGNYIRQLRMKSHNLQSQMVLHRIKTGNMILWNEEKWRQKETITIYIITFSS